MIKKLGTVILTIALICSLTACGGTTTDNGDDNVSEINQSETNQSETDTEKDTKSSKKKYKNINADTKPIGVDGISVKMDGNYPRLFCTIHKNGGSIEESIVYVKFEMFNENNEYIGTTTLKTTHSLIEGDTETVNASLAWDIAKENYNDEVLSKYSANVVEITENDAAEAEEAEALAKVMNEIENKITYDKEYNSALAMLEVVKEQYPDSVEVKLFEAQVKDELAKKGINIDGTPITTENPAQEQTE